ncbi:MAG: HEAT repeat domain-containing protein, partial [Desulfobacteraceae bacterium]
LLAVDAGFSTQYEDVRRRALEILIRVISKNPTQLEPKARKLILKALNDDAVVVRNEAFKAAFNLQMDGGQQQTLVFLLHSVHTDIRGKVLIEVVANKKTVWAQSLLTAFFNDQDKALRTEAFGYAVEKKKKTPLTVMTAGMDSQFEDIRLKTVEELVKYLNDATQKMVVNALNDKSKTVRQGALYGLIEKGVEEALSNALISKYHDIRCRAAEVAAGLGDKDAFQPLVDILAENEPKDSDKKKEWIVTIQTALKGLGLLGAPEAIEPVNVFLSHENNAIRSHAIDALIRVSRPDQDSALQQALKHSDQRVRLRAALGLAYCGNPVGEQLLSSKTAPKEITKEEKLIAAFILAATGIEKSTTDANDTNSNHFDRLLFFLDQSDKCLQQTAFLLLLLAELEIGTEVPKHCIACLAALEPKIRLAAAGALEVIAHDFGNYITRMLNDRANEAPWTIPTETTLLLGRLLFNGPLHIRVDTLHLLLRLKTLQTKEKTQTNWEKAWKIHLKRYHTEIAEIRDRIKPVKKPKYNRNELLQLAFGTYVGLVRDQSRSGSQNVTLNRRALLRIFALAAIDKSMAAAAKPVFVQTLANPNKDVRLLAFEHLGNLGMDKKELGSEALRVGHKDLGVIGLKLLMSNASKASGQALLENVVMLRKDGLEIEAAKLLAEQIGRSAAWEKALQAMSKSLRHMAVKWLIADYDQDEKAVYVLRTATKSRYAAIRLEAALALGEKKDQEAFDALASLLAKTREADEQRKLVRALNILRDKRTPDLLLDRLENDPAATADSDLLINAAGNFRLKGTFERLMVLFKQDKYKKSAFWAMFTISGFKSNDYPINLEIIQDQNGQRKILQYQDVVETVKDPDFQLTLEQIRKLKPDDTWSIGDSLSFEIDEKTYEKICQRRMPRRDKVENQYPRHTDLLARLLAEAINQNELELARQLITSAKLARENAVNASLAILTQSADENIRHDAIKAAGWRLKFRKGPAEPLLIALAHKDPVTKFLSAEALAKAKRTEGIQVLLAAVDLMPDLKYRRRAVQRLGELADKRALDLLLRLANEDAHALQDEAMEAIGHMGKT